jgi:hypothetical protein
MHIPRAAAADLGTCLDTIKLPSVAALPLDEDQIAIG